MPKSTDRSVRTTITIPPDVKARMEAAGDAVNWSAVAAAAFRAKLLELDSKKEVGTMSDVIERLRASKKKRCDELYQQGRKAGESWAKQSAEAHELMRLAEGPPDSSRYTWDGWLGVYDNGLNRGVATGLYGDITGQDQRDVDRHSAEAFWEQAVGDRGAERIADHSFALGFIEGATAVWETVADKLDDAGDVEE
jgi:hypothetical protein